MHQRLLRKIIIVLITALASATIAFSQSSNPPETSEVPVSNTWPTADATMAPKEKLFVVTVDRPDHRQACRVESFTLEKLVCSRAFGAPRTYFRQHVLALILPGDLDLKLLVLAGLNGGLGAAIWGTVALTAACPACAVATGIAALLLFCAAGAVAIGDDTTDHLLYLAPGQHLTGKLRGIQP